MAKKFTFDDAITTDIKGAASNSYIDNIKMIKIADIEINIIYNTVCTFHKSE